MATTMKIKKGDTVQVLAGKDRGKQGRVIEARPSEGRVIVENLNLVKRHRKPAPIRDASRMGGAQMTPGGIFEKPSPIDDLERHARVPDLQAGDPRRRPRQGAQGRDGARPLLQALQRGGRPLMATATETYLPRLKQRYDEEIRPALKDELELDSIMRVPKVTKITLNMGVGDAKTDAKAMDAAIEELSTIAGQRAQIRRARKSIASFKLREGMAVGARVTLRGARMYEFLDRLVSISLPRIRDFRGLNPDSFDGRGNYSLGIKEQIIFPEIDYDSVQTIRGLDIAITTIGRNGRAGACAAAPPRPAVRHRSQKGLGHGQDLAPRQAEADAEVQDPGVHAVQPVRPAARRLQEVQALPDLPARARASGRDPGHDQEFLVMKRPYQP